MCIENSHSSKFIEDKEDVLRIHDELLIQYGGIPGIRDEGSLESALYQAQTTFGGEFLHPTIIEQAAAYLFHIIKNHAFLDGNKRTGYGVMITFLNQNDYDLNMTSDEAYKLTVQVADNKVGKEKLIEILRGRITELF
jgi:death-on-curing protein